MMRQAQEATPGDAVGAGGQNVSVHHRASTLQYLDLQRWAVASLPCLNLSWEQKALADVPCDQPCDQRCGS